MPSRRPVEKSVHDILGMVNALQDRIVGPVHRDDSILPDYDTASLDGTRGALLELGVPKRRVRIGPPDRLGHDPQRVTPLGELVGVQGVSDLAGLGKQIMASPNKSSAG